MVDAPLRSPVLPGIGGRGRDPIYGGVPGVLALCWQQRSPDYVDSNHTKSCLFGFLLVFIILFFLIINLC